MRKKKKKTHIPFRINALFFVVFLLFSSLILQLGMLQIVEGKDYKEQLVDTKNVIVKTPVPRGSFYDRHHRLVVDNKPLNSITYTRHDGSSQMKRLDTAKKLSAFIEMNTDDLTERDLKDFWILTRPQKALEKVNDTEKNQLNDQEIYELQLERINESDLEEITEEELEILAIKRQFDKSYSMTPHIVKKQGVTKEEYAVVSEHLSQLPGVDVTTSWIRTYPYGELFKNYIGSVTTDDQGIPKDQLDYYLSRGYKRNDQIGISYLEKQYEDVLKGQKTKVTNVLDQEGVIIERKVNEQGKRGNDLILTIDMELQQKIEKIIEEELRKAKWKEGNELLDSAFVVMMNPSNGEIYSLAGKRLSINNGRVNFTDLSLGTTNYAYVMGSTVKGATILTGYHTGVINPGETLLDRPIKIKATKPLSSWYNMGYVNDLRALKESSNVYMFRIAMEMGEYQYRYNEASPFRNPGAFETMRKYFSQFGLGVKTGIDLPIEGEGYQGNKRTIGSLMYLAIGQFDSYTPLQLAQYISTIANDGYRMQPRLVKEIREPTENGELGRVIKSFGPTVLNRVEMEKKYIDRVQEGFRRVMQERKGTAYEFFVDAPYNPAGKTGTAETYYFADPDHPRYGDPITNLTLVAYAPYHNPEIAISVVVPYANSDYRVDKVIGRRVLDTFFEMQG